MLFPHVFSFHCSMFMVCLHFHCRLAPPLWVKFRYFLAFSSFICIILHYTSYFLFFFFHAQLYFCYFFFFLFFFHNPSWIALHCIVILCLRFFFPNFLIYQFPFLSPPSHAHTYYIYTHICNFFFLHNIFDSLLYLHNSFSFSKIY